ncbi:MAG: hypothetical protein AAF318_09890 [Pseudomonadota bacterium]
MRLTPLLTNLARSATAAGYMDVADWANSERQGYRSDVPVYRRVTGVPMGFSPMKGWVPLFVENKALLREVGAHGLRQSIGHIENAIANSDSGKAYVHYTSEEIGLINIAAGTRFAQMASAIDIGALQRIVTSVTSLARQWSHQIHARTPPTPPKDPPTIAA